MLPNTKLIFFVFFFAIISNALCAPTESHPQKRKMDPVEIIWHPFMNFMKGYYEFVHTLGIKPFQNIFGLFFGGQFGCANRENNVQLFYKSTPDHVLFQPACFANLIKVAKTDSSDIILAPASCFGGSGQASRDLPLFRAEVDGKLYKVVDKSEYDGDESDASEIKKKYKLVKLEAAVPFTNRPACIPDDRIRGWAERFLKKPVPYQHV